MTTHVLNSIHDDLGNLIERIEPGHPILLQCGDTALGALVSIDDLRLLEHYLVELEDRLDLEEARKALEEVGREGALPYRTVRQELGL